METKLQKPRVRRSTHKMSDQCITTSDLFDVQPVLSRMVIPHDSFNIEMNQLNRCSPMPYSSFVKIKNRMAAFFVKYSQIWKPFDCFISQTPYAFFDNSWNNTNTVPTELPYVTPLDLQRILMFPGLVSRTSIGPTNYAGIQTLIDNHAYDFYDIVFDSTPGHVASGNGVTLTPAGRVVYKVLYSLGYRIPLVSVSGSYKIDGTTGNTFSNDLSKVHMSLLPLIAFLSVKINYYTPVKYRDYKYMNSLVYLVNPWINRATGPYGGVSTTNVDFGLLSFIVETIINTYYGEDYFTSSLVRPQKVGAFIDTNDPSSNPGFGLHQLGNGTAYIGLNHTPLSGDGFDLYLLNVLKNQTSFNQLSALTQNDVVGAVTSKLGYKPEQADMVPFLLSHDNSFIKVSPILQSADTAENHLGYKAGTADGTLQMKNNFNFDTFGHLLYVSSISPDIMYYQGIKRELQLTTPDLHYNPMNTNVGIQATGKSEICIDINPDELDDAFGFREKYAELGCSQDILSGDFVIPTRNVTLDAMHFGRNFFFNYTLGLNSVDNNLEFQLGRHYYHNDNYTVVGLSIPNQYDRIFVNEDETEEHVEQWDLFDITATRSIAPSGDYTIGDDNNGDVVENTGIAKVENN